MPSRFAWSCPGRGTELKSGKYLHGFLNLYSISHASTQSHLRVWKNKKTSEWFPDLLICSDKTIAVLIATHPHESRSEQPETALHCKKQCLINHPEKITALFISPQPAPPWATVQNHCRTSCRKYQTLTPPLVQQTVCVSHCVSATGCCDHTATASGSTIWIDECQQRKYQQVLVYPLLVPESLYFAGGIAAAVTKTITEHRGAGWDFVPRAACSGLSLSAHPGLCVHPEEQVPKGRWIFAWSKDVLVTETLNFIQVSPVLGRGQISWVLDSGLALKICKRHTCTSFQPSYCTTSSIPTSEHWEAGLGGPPSLLTLAILSKNIIKILL